MKNNDNKQQNKSSNEMHPRSFCSSFFLLEIKIKIVTVLMLLTMMMMMSTKRRNAIRREQKDERTKNERERVATRDGNNIQ